MSTDPLFVKQNGQHYFYHTDHLGTPQKLTSVNGAVVWSAMYSSFGYAQVLPSSTVENNFRFPGQYYDQETGLHYNLHRYYDPGLGRYLRADPIGLDGGNNPFIYAENNPIRYFDVFGLYCCKGNKVVPDEQCCDNVTKAEKAGAWAQYQHENGNKNYNKSANNPSCGGSGAWKCNCFVRDALKIGGGFTTLPKHYHNNKKTKYFPQANEIADTSKNTDVLGMGDGSVGDIVAWPSQSGSGHVGIVGCDGKIYNAREFGTDRFNQKWGYNNWYYRWNGRSPVYRKMKE